MDSEGSNTPNISIINNPLANLKNFNSPSPITQDDKYREICLNKSSLNSEHKQKLIKDLISDFRFNVNSMIDFSIVEKNLDKFNENKSNIVKNKLDDLKKKT